MLTLAHLRTAKNLALGISIALSCVLLIQHSHWRDQVAQKYISGYTVSVNEDTNEGGQIVSTSSASAAAPTGNFVLWIFEWAYFAIALLVPYLTWFFGNRAVKPRCQ